MSNLQLPTINSHADAMELLDGKESMKIGYKTWLHYWDSDGSVAIVYFDTAIVVYDLEGGIELNAGGWHTTTTTDRMHRLTPPHVRVFHRSGKKVDEPTIYVEFHGNIQSLHDGEVMVAA